MKIQTLSLVVDAPCNAKCPYCISQMTGAAPEISTAWVNEQKLNKAIMAATIGGATTALITGKGEPTLNPAMVTQYVRRADENFPFVELQTNGLVFMDEDYETEMTLGSWQADGLTTLAISVVGYDDDTNRAFYRPDGPYDLLRLVKIAHDTGLMVRITCTMFRNGIDTLGQILKLIAFCRENKIEQLALGPVTAPDVVRSNNKSIRNWVDAHQLGHDETNRIAEYFDQHAQKLLTLPHGATIYDYRDVSVCIRECLTLRLDTDEVRQLIFYPSGRLTYDWQYKGAVLL